MAITHYMYHFSHCKMPEAQGYIHFIAKLYIKILESEFLLAILHNLRIIFFSHN